jgi:hypothetical protein
MWLYSIGSMQLHIFYMLITHKDSLLPVLPSSGHKYVRTVCTVFNPGMVVGPWSKNHK